MRSDERRCHALVYIIHVYLPKWVKRVFYNKANINRKLRDVLTHSITLVIEIVVLCLIYVLSSQVGEEGVQ